MRKNKSEIEIRSELRNRELANAAIIEFEEPKSIWKCSYIHYKYIPQATDEGVKRVLKKETGTLNIRSSSDQTAINGATSQLYEILNAEPGCIIVMKAELIGNVEANS